MARVSNWAKTPRGYASARLVGARPTVLLGNSGIGIRLQNGERHLVIVLKLDEAESLLRDLAHILQRGIVEDYDEDLPPPVAELER